MKMSLSKSEKSVFQFSKITTDNAKRSNEKVLNSAKSDEEEPEPGQDSGQPAEGEAGGESGGVLSSEGIIAIILLSSAALAFLLLYLAISRHLPLHLTNCSYFPQDLTDKTEEFDDQNNCEDEFVYISPLTSV